MARLARMVFTWLSSEPGGAEESVRSLAVEVGRRYGLRPTVVFWQYSGVPPTGPARGPPLKYHFGCWLAPGIASGIGRSALTPT